VDASVRARLAFAGDISGGRGTRQNSDNTKFRLTRRAKHLYRYSIAKIVEPLNFGEVITGETISSLSIPRATIISPSSSNGRCSAFASSHGGPQPNVPLFVRGQDHRHGLAMDRFDDGIRTRGEEAIELVQSGNGL
jgi:hypothetical protein